MDIHSQPRTVTNDKVEDPANNVIPKEKPRRSVNWERILAIMTVIILALQSFIFWRQTQLFETQARLADYQLQLTKQQQESVEISTRTELQKAMLSIFYTAVERAQADTTEKKLTWLRKIDGILTSQMTNSALTKNAKCHDLWLNAMGKTNTLTNLLIHSPSQETDDLFSKGSNSIMGDAMCDWEMPIRPKDDRSASSKK